MSKLRINFCGVECENPFFLASSVVGSNYEMCSRALEAGWGGVVFKTIGLGKINEVSPRFDIVKRTSNSPIGLKNLEQISDHSLEQNLRWMRRLKEDYPEKVLVASIMGDNEDEWRELAIRCTEVGADILECNFSCPQMTEGATRGCEVGQNLKLVEKYCRAIREVTNLPVLAKMTPNIADITPPAIASIKGGATGIAAINTVKSLTSINLEDFSSNPSVNGKTSVSGYSGNAVKPIALRFINDLAKCPELKGVPISGIGGIETWEDALEFLLLGATNLQVTTAIMNYGYRIIEDLTEGLELYLDQHGFKSINDIIGLALKNVVTPDELDRSFIRFPKFKDDTCIGCGRCYISCQDGGHQAIVWDRLHRKPILDKSRCVGCHLCTNICPIGNIGVSEEMTVKKEMLDI